MKKIGLIALIVVLSLGIIGVGYAAWSQTLNITGTAAVATFNVSMTCGTIVAADKPVDSDGTTFTVAPDTAARASYNPSGNSGLVVTITNAVPGTYTIPGVVITNNSTIPLDVNVTATATSDTSGGKLDGSSYVDAAPLAAFKTAATVDPLAASGGATTAKDITITIPDGATQGATYSFIIQVTATQS